MSILPRIRIRIGALALLAGCAGAPGPQDLDRATQAVMQNSFRAQGIATLDRLVQDEVQQACSAETPPPPARAAQLEAAQLASVQWPQDGVYLGDWREGEKLAQNGRGGTWSDAPGVPAGGNCYNCHQLAKAEIAFGTIGPSLYQYGKLRGVADPADPAAAAVVRYTWGKLWNAKAYNACSAMPRFGHQGVLTPAQIKDLMALLLDPKSPVNAP
ncbi:MAG TPA: sulfur oxidation c-type cytochrome SoxX [Burkholderiaceae bacterium]|nr:sulfur oxidation c-type cytochrome SoxX [Burkholderiaceae bacterium]